MEHPSLPPTPSSSSLSQPADARQVLLPVLAGIALLAVGVFVYFQFFSQDPKSAFHEEPSGEVQEGADEASEKDAVYQADYDEGYSAGYADGRSVNGEFYDSYDEPATLERQDGYFEGYFAGFLRGCEEGDFDCSAIENYRIDYDAGYDAGYLDGYEEFGTFFDSYAEPLEEYRQRAYLTGYFDGFLGGCEDGGFDCSEVQAHRDVYDAAYEVGYADGESPSAEFLDSYAEPLREDFLGSYNEGYFDGFLDGCYEGNFDCTEVSQYRDQLAQENAENANSAGEESVPEVH